MTTLPLYRSTLDNTIKGEHRAYTARPDLWPPGSYVHGGHIHAPWAWGYSWWPVARDRADASVRDGCHLPGHAEAAILAGRVTQMVPDRWDGSWTEVTP